MSEAPWAKIWWDWYASRSHIGLSGIALALGAPLMLICRESAERHNRRHCDARGDAHGDDAGDAETLRSDLVWILDKSGKPIRASHIAKIARFDVPDVEAALQELVDAETLVVSADGVYGFPNFWRYQETAAAARTRKYREKKRRHSDAIGDAHGDGHRDDKRTEDRGQRIPLATQEGESAPGAPPADTDFSSGGYYQTFRDTFAAEASRMGFKAPPEPMPSQLRSGSKRAGAYARATKIPFAQACIELVRAALEAQRATGKDAGLHLLAIEPGQPLPMRQTGLRPARASPSPATTGKDFEDEEDESVQIARLQRGTK